MNINKIVKVYLFTTVLLIVITCVFYIFFMPKSSGDSIPLISQKISEEKYLYSNNRTYSLQSVHKIPTLNKEHFIFVRSWYQHIIVVLNEEVIYMTPQQEFTGKVINHVAPIPVDASNKEMKIYAYTSWKFFENWTEDLFLDSPESLITNLLSDSALEQFLSTITVSGGITLIFIAFGSILKKTILGTYCFSVYSLYYLDYTQ